MSRSNYSCAAIALLASACTAVSAIEDAGVELDAAPMVLAPDASAETPDCGAATACGVACTSLESDPSNCGACGRSCIIPNASAGCAAEECVIASCADGFFDNDGDVMNGCEHLDACVEDAPCATACGSEGLTRCDRGVASCEPRGEQCNLADDDCNGQCDEGSLAGCRVGVHRSHGDGHLYTTDLGQATSPPFNLEAQNYFFMYAQQVPESRPVFLCRKGDGKRFLTSSTDCEFAGGLEQMVGYWTPEPSCGTVALHRLYHAPSNNHFYTLSEAERDNAVTAYGYESQGIAGYVWSSP